MTLKQMEEELGRLKADAMSSGEALKAKDSEIESLKAKDEASQKTIADLNAQLSAANESAAKLKEQNEALSTEAVKLKASVEEAQKSASLKVLQITAESGHPAPIQGQSPKDDGKSEQNLKGHARAVAAFVKKHPQFA